MATYPIRQLADNGGTAQFVPVTAPEAVQFPDGSNLNTLIGSIATIESNPVAANHAVGEFLCVNGQVYEVIDAITAGDSIALGENVQVTNLGSQITALNNGLVHTVAIRQTTDSSGNITLNDYSPSDYTLIGGYSDRTVNSDAMRVFISTTAAGSYYLLNIGNGAGANVANRAVRVIITYLENR